MSGATSLRVPKPLRERLKANADADGVTLATFLDRLVAEHERHQRMAAVRAAYASGRDADYDTLTTQWDEATAADGLDQ